MAVYVDYIYSGLITPQGNLGLVKDQAALSNAVTLWLCSFRGERLYRPTKGGYIVGALMKPISEERATEIAQDIKTGLRTDFQPSIEVNSCSVTPDYENKCYTIVIDGYCPSFKASVYTETRLNALYK